jgi:hypothetical protein
MVDHHSRAKIIGLHRLSSSFVRKMGRRIRKEELGSPALHEAEVSF